MFILRLIQKSVHNFVAQSKRGNKSGSGSRGIEKLPRLGLRSVKGAHTYIKKIMQHIIYIIKVQPFQGVKIWAKVHHKCKKRARVPIYGFLFKISSLGLVYELIKDQLIKPSDKFLFFYTRIVQKLPSLLGVSSHLKGSGLPSSFLVGSVGEAPLQEFPASKVHDLINIFVFILLIFYLENKYLYMRFYLCNPKHIHARFF